MPRTYVTNQPVWVLRLADGSLQCLLSPAGKNRLVAFTSEEKANRLTSELGCPKKAVRKVEADRLFAFFLEMVAANIHHVAFDPLFITVLTAEGEIDLSTEDVPVQDILKDMHGDHVAPD